MSRSWFWGHPAVIAALELLARRAQAAGLPVLYMNDISRPHGGPTAGMHASHMLGLDADVWLDVRPKPALTPAVRDAVEVQSLVTPDGRGVDPSLWTPAHGLLLRMATSLPGVDRVLVNPAIKQQLCLETTGDRSWLHLIRPWYGHTAHMHIHFRCPPGQTECRDQAPIPPGDGCDASLDWWFAQLDKPPPPVAPARPPKLPAACAAILSLPFCSLSPRERAGVRASKQALAEEPSPNPLPRGEGFDRRRMGVAVAGFCTFINLYAPQSLLPTLADAFGASVAHTGLTVTACLLAVAFVAPFVGGISDAFGRRKLILGASFALGVPTRPRRPRADPRAAGAVPLRPGPFAAVHLRRDASPTSPTSAPARAGVRATGDLTRSARSSAASVAASSPDGSRNISAGGPLPSCSPG